MWYVNTFQLSCCFLIAFHLSHPFSLSSYFSHINTSLPPSCTLTHLHTHTLAHSHPCTLTRTLLVRGNLDSERCFGCPGSEGDSSDEHRHTTRGEPYRVLPPHLTSVISCIYTVSTFDIMNSEGGREGRTDGQTDGQREGGRKRGEKEGERERREEG